MQNLKKTARAAGLWYLGLAVSGLIGFLFVRAELFVDGDAAATAANLVEREGLARLGVAAEIAIVGTQALAALYFFRLFRSVDLFAATSLLAFAFMNSVAIMASAAFIATGLDVALDAGSTETVQLMYTLSENAWGVGNLFFGLWLIPMGVLAWRSGFMPRALGWILIAGGAGYVAAAFTTYLLPDATALTEYLPFFATIGEFWIIAYLLIFGVRTSALEGAAPGKAVASN